jgi:hypothetical protein
MLSNTITTTNNIYCLQFISPSILVVDDPRVVFLSTCKTKGFCVESDIFVMFHSTHGDQEDSSMED